MPALLSLASVYNTILFYFAFNEKIAPVHIFGMIIMITGVAFLGLESGGEEPVDVSTTPSIASAIAFNENKTRNGIIAMTYGVLAPGFFTVKAYSIRKYPDYIAWDLGIDSLTFEYACYVIMYAVYVAKVSFVFEDFLYG